MSELLAVFKFSRPGLRYSDVLLLEWVVVWVVQAMLGVNRIKEGPGDALIWLLKSLDEVSELPKETLLHSRSCLGGLRGESEKCW